MSYFDTAEKKYCCGCEACEQVCPKNAIMMESDFEGFLYPKIHKELCINCDLCKKVCPISNDLNHNMLDKRRVYCIHTNDFNLRTKSSSGGAFSIISETFCDENYVIFGATYDENFNVFHDHVDCLENIDRFRKSKYVQSSINNSYRKVLEYLKQNKKVLFTGTPCQISGLKQFLKKDYENLLCVEIICHGVPSKKVWNKYLEYIGKKYSSKITNINFRQKVENNGEYNSRNIKISLENGKEIIEDSTKNLYLRGFHNKLFYRDSCTICKFADPVRYADITIADCWGIEDVDSSIDVHKGASLVIINTKKGIKIWNKIKSDISLFELNLDFAESSNEQFSKPTKVHRNRDEFYRNLDKLPFNRNINKNIPQTLKQKVKVVLPNRIKIKLKKIIKY